MSKFKLSILFVVMSAFCIPAMAGEKVVKRVPAGAAAFHFVADLSYMTGELVGYIAFIEGVDGSLFSGPPSKDTAYFTLRITKPPGWPIPLPVETGSELSASLIEPGAQFMVFFDPNAGPVDYRDWSKPKTFGDPWSSDYGVPIAVFEESALLSTGSAGASFNVFSSRLLDSNPIDFNGQRIDFKKLVPNGVTTTNYTSPRFAVVGDVVVPAGASFGATAIAIGGKLRDESDSDDD